MHHRNGPRTIGQSRSAFRRRLDTRPEGQRVGEKRADEYGKVQTSQKRGHRRMAEAGRPPSGLGRNGTGNPDRPDRLLAGRLLGPEPPAHRPGGDVTQGRRRSLLLVPPHRHPVHGRSHRRTQPTPAGTRQGGKKHGGSQRRPAHHSPGQQPGAAARKPHGNAGVSLETESSRRNRKDGCPAWKS